VTAGLRALACGAWLATCGIAAQPLLTQTPVYRAGEGGYHTYRIPSLLATGNGTLLAFCEGRKNSSSDTGDIDLLVKRSFDNGKTWTAAKVVADHDEDTIGNPCPVVDRSTGTIWLLLTGNPGAITEKQIMAGEGARTVWLTHSDDDGATWTPLTDITEAAKRPDWTWYATGPGNGIQLENGRLVIPCDHADKGTGARHSHVIYSDDHGKTWKTGGSLAENTNECQVAELVDGRLLINMRSYAGKNRRAIAHIRDGGLTWSQVRLDEALVEPVCQASLLRFTTRTKNRLLFSNPADLVRAKMTVRLSYDEGGSWPVARMLWDGPAAYSSLAVLRDSTIGCLYERGEKSAYETITFAHFNLEWLSYGEDRLP
jgi:sialidase-1